MTKLAAVCVFVMAAVARADEVKVDDVLRDVAEREGAVLSFVDDALRGKIVNVPFLADQPPTGLLRSLLSDSGVEVIDDELGGKKLVRAFLQRNLCQMLVKDPPLSLGEKDPIPEGNRYVSKTFRVAHGDSMSIQTVIRAEMTRDPRRVGNVTWTKASETLTITDLAPNLRRYAQLIADLDRPSPADARLDNVRLDVEIWSVARQIAEEMRERPTELQEALRGAPDTRRLHWFTSTGSRTGAAGITVDSSDAGSSATAADDFSLKVEAKPFAETGALGVRLRISFVQGSTKLDLPMREVYLRPGVWALVHADAGLALLVRAREE